MHARRRSARRVALLAGAAADQALFAAPLAVGLTALLLVRLRQHGGHARGAALLAGRAAGLLGADEQWDGPVAS